MKCGYQRMSLPEDDSSSDTCLIKNQVRIMLYFSKIQDDSYWIIAPISCIMASFHKMNQTDIIGCVQVV